MKISSLRESVFNFIISAIFRKIYHNLFQVSNHYKSLQPCKTGGLSYTFSSPDKPLFPYRSTYFSSPRIYLKLFAYLYRNQGYDFTITSSTAYDQKWMYGRNIYSNISQLVDSIFANFLSRPGVRQPIFTSYCNGTTATCTGLSQWGSKYLGEQGYTPIEIVRYYYGNDMYINTATSVSGIPSSWPGYDLTIGSSGEKVRQLQQQLNRIAQNYPALPTLAVDGVYGSNTANAVRIFQRIFGLPQTGIVDYPTWYKISEVFVGVSRISEPD